MVRSAAALAIVRAIGSAGVAEESATLFIGGELFPDMGPTRAFVAWEVDGEPLSPEEAPFRLVVTTDKEPSRSLYKLTRLEIVDLGGR